MIRVLIADDQALIAASFARLLAAEDDLDVVATAASGQEAVSLARRHRPDVVLMDVRMPDGDGIAATSQLLTDPGLTTTRVIMVTTFGIDEYITDALAAGASGFLLKDTDPDDLIDAVRVVHRGDALLSPAVTRSVLEQVAKVRSDTDPSLLDGLTEREREVVREVARGASNAEIATRLTISPLTAKTHVSRCLAKLGLRDRAQLVVAAYESGLVRPGESGTSSG